VGETLLKGSRKMHISINKEAIELGKAAGADAATAIRRALSNKETASIILATGTSQFETLNALISASDIDWSRVVMFHLDEYIGLPVSHPASFRKYLSERFLSNVPPLLAAHLVNGETDPIAECSRLGALIKQHPVDVALVGIGENCHLAFNDPPADFDNDAPFIVVTLDDQCVQQQYGEGWFVQLEDVPRRAISMSIKQIMKSVQIICSVPDARKAQAVRNALEHPVDNRFPASILQQHDNCTIYLDHQSASLLVRQGSTSQ
jgi:glucosamine-6-phosphate deaminase